MSNPGSIYKKMSEVMKMVKAVTKDQTNSAQGFKFRGIDQFVNALYPALTANNVFMAPRCTSYTQELREVTRSNGKAAVDKHVAIMMEYDFWAEDGSKVTIGPIPAEGLDSGDKATNKALSAGLKYALIQTFSVPTADMAEADLDSPEIGANVPTKTVNGTKTAAEAKAVSTPVANTTTTAAPTKRTVASFAKAKATTPVAPTTAPIANGSASKDNNNGWEN